MKLMERYGNRIFEYEGICRGALEIDEDTLPFKGYYEAAQYSSGRFEVGVIVTDPPPSNTDTFPFPPREPSKLTFEGTSTEGWSIKPSGCVFFSNIGWVMELRRLKRSGETLSAPYFRTYLRQESEGCFGKARFLASNLLWKGLSTGAPDPIVLQIQDFQILVDPVDDYDTVAEYLTNRHEVEPTAWINIEVLKGPHHPLATFRDLVDDLMCVLRLVTGNHVNWYYGEGLDDSTGKAVERVHQNAQSRPYSNTIKFSPRENGTQYLVPKLDIVALAKAFFNESSHVLDKKTLKALVNQFTEAANDRHYLESRGLLASTLIELIASKYANLRNKSNAIPGKRYKKEVYPELESVIADSALKQTEREHILRVLLGGHRSTLNQKLKLLRDDLNLPLADEGIETLVKSRNALVHQGVYASTANVAEWHNDYNFMVHMALNSLCRLSGYDGHLPEFKRDWPIQV